MRRTLALTATSVLTALFAVPAVAASTTSEVPVRGNMDVVISCRDGVFVPHNGTLLETRETTVEEGITYQHVTHTEGSTLTFRDTRTGKLVHVDPLNGPGTPGTYYVGWVDASGQHHYQHSYAWTWRQGNTVQVLEVTMADGNVTYSPNSSCELIG